MERVLLIEDHDGDAALVLDMLAGSGFEAERAKTIDQGVVRLGEVSFDAVLLDLSLPDSRGIESVQTLRVFDAQIPLVVLTGLDDDDAAMAAIAAGAHDYLVKGRTEAEALVRALSMARQRVAVEQELGTAPPTADAPASARAGAWVCPTGPHFFPALAKRLGSVEGILYVTADRPAAIVRRRFDEVGVDADRLHFIDASGGPADAEGRIFVLEDPQDLDALALEVERGCAGLGSETTVVVDSVNSLLLHHGVDATAVFCHALANRLRLLGIPSHFLGHDNQEWPFIADRLSFLDDIVVLSGDDGAPVDPSVA